MIDFIIYFGIASVGITFGGFIGALAAQKSAIINRQIIWNGVKYSVQPEFEPSVSGLKAAGPYVDVRAAVIKLISTGALDGEIERAISRNNQRKGQS